MCTQKAKNLIISQKFYELVLLIAIQYNLKKVNLIKFIYLETKNYMSLRILILKTFKQNLAHFNKFKK